MTVQSCVVVSDLTTEPVSSVSLASRWRSSAAAARRRPVDALFAPMCTPGVRGGHGRGIQRNHVPDVADGGAQPVGKQPVPGTMIPPLVAMSMNSAPTGG